VFVFQVLPKGFEQLESYTELRERLKCLNTCKRQRGRGWHMLHYPCTRLHVTELSLVRIQNPPVQLPYSITHPHLILTVRQENRTLAYD